MISDFCYAKAAGQVVAPQCPAPRGPQGTLLVGSSPGQP